MALSRLERETLICYNEEEQTADVFTYNVALIHKLEALCGERPNEARERKKSNTAGGRFFIIPKKWVKVSPPRKVNMSDEERKRRRDLMTARRINSEVQKADINTESEQQT